VGRADRLPAMPGLKAAGCRAGRLSDHAGLKGCWLPGWSFLGLKADCVPVGKGRLVVVGAWRLTVCRAG